MRISFNIEIEKIINFAVFADENKSVILQPSREKQKYRVTVVNKSVSITFDVLVLLEIKCSK